MAIKRLGRMLWACGALLFATGCSAQASDEQRFAAGMIRQLKARVPGAEVVQLEDPLSVEVRQAGRAERSFNFHRLYAYCRQVSAAECRETRREFLDMVLLDRAPPTPASLRIAVRDAEYVRNARGLGSGEAQLIAEPIGDDLFAVLVSDAPDSTATVPPDSLASLGLTRAQAWARGWQQTTAKLPALPTPAALAQGAVLYQEQTYLASLLADTKGWAAIARDAGPDLFVTVVSDDIVFVATMPDGPRLEKFKQTVREDCASQIRCLSPHLYRFRDGRWALSR